MGGMKDLLGDDPPTIGDSRRQGMRIFSVHCVAGTAGAEAGCLQIGRGSRNGHQPLHHRRKQNAKAFRLDGVCQDNQNQTRLEPSVWVSALDPSLHLAA